MSDPASQVPEVLTDAVEQISTDHSKLSIDALLMLLHSERLKTLREQTSKEFKELSERQGLVRKLHEVMKGLNKATSEKGDLNIKDNPELQDHLKTAKELGVDIKEEKTKYSKDERDRLIENLRMTIEDHNVQNDMQLQTVQRLTNERYESYQMARTILKPLHDDKLNKARKVAG